MSILPACFGLKVKGLARLLLLERLRTPEARLSAPQPPRAAAAL